MFEIYEDKNNEWRWRLKAGNGEIIAVSEGYTTKQNLLKNIESVRQNTDGPISESTK